VKGRPGRAGALRLVYSKGQPALDLRARGIADAIAEELAEHREATQDPPSRIEASLHVGLVCGGQHWVGYTETLDVRGIYVTTYLTRPIGSDVELLLELPTGRVLDIHAVVAGVRPEGSGPTTLPGMELRVVSMSSVDTACYAAWLDSRSTHFWSRPDAWAIDA